MANAIFQVLASQGAMSPLDISVEGFHMSAILQAPLGDVSVEGFHMSAVMMTPTGDISIEGVHGLGIIQEGQNGGDVSIEGIHGLAIVMT